MKKFSKVEDELLRQCYGRAETRKIAIALGRSTYSIQQRARRLGVTIRRWSSGDDAELLRDYGNVPLAELAERFGRSKAAVRTHYRKLMLKQREETMEVSL